MSGCALCALYHVTALDWTSLDFNTFIFLKFVFLYFWSLYFIALKFLKNGLSSRWYSNRPHFCLFTLPLKERQSIVTLNVFFDLWKPIILVPGIMNIRGGNEHLYSCCLALDAWSGLDVVFLRHQIWAASSGLVRRRIPEQRSSIGWFGRESDADVDDITFWRSISRVG